MLVLAALTAMAVPTILGFRSVSARHGRRRNAHGCCAACGAAWAARYPDVDQYLVGGQYVCEPCAVQLRRRVHHGVVAIGLVSTGVAAATLVSNGFDMIAGNIPFAWWPLLYWAAPVSVLGTLAGLGAWRLQADNRAALVSARGGSRPRDDVPSPLRDSSRQPISRLTASER